MGCINTVTSKPRQQEKIVSGQSPTPFSPTSRMKASARAIPIEFSALSVVRIVRLVIGIFSADSRKIWEKYGSAC